MSYEDRINAIYENRRTLRSTRVLSIARAPDGGNVMDGFRLLYPDPNVWAWFVTLTTGAHQ